MSFLANDIISVCQETFGAPDICIFSPGRANIIGEHTDYTYGFVMPFASKQGIYYAAKKISGHSLEIISLNTNEKISISQQTEANDALPGWTKYILQILQKIKIDTSDFGLGVVFGGDLPVGAGMSSSSSLTCGFLSVCNLLFNLNLSLKETIIIAVEAEHGTGVQGGMMDQYAIMSGVSDYALCLDCKTLTHQLVPVPSEEFGFYLLNTNVKHELVVSPYNQRRFESELALDKIRSHNNNPDLEYRNLSENDLLYGFLDSVLQKRAGHIISENIRVKKMVTALQENDFTTAGNLLCESHNSLSRDYEVSCPELDFLISSSIGLSGWKGGRMMGGGFGGCTINLIHHEHVEKYFDIVSGKYFQQFGIETTLIPAIPSSGLHTL